MSHRFCARSTLLNAETDIFAGWLNMQQSNGFGSYEPLLLSATSLTREQYSNEKSVKRAHPAPSIHRFVK